MALDSLSWLVYACFNGCDRILVTVTCQHVLEGLDTNDCKLLNGSTSADALAMKDVDGAVVLHTYLWQTYPGGSNIVNLKRFCNYEVLEYC
jgi:hypothetical protein